MFTRLRGIPTPIWALIVIAACFGLWHALPESLRNQIQPTAHAATFTVNTADDHDDGVCNAADCTLREAINAANANAGADTITFNIGSGGPQTALASAPSTEIPSARAMAQVMARGLEVPSPSPVLSPIRTWTQKLPLLSPHMLYS